MDEVHHPAIIGARYHDVIERSSTAARGALQAPAGVAGGVRPVEPDAHDLPATAACIAANSARSGPRQLLLDVSDLAGAAPLQGDMVLNLIDTPPDGYRVEPVTLADGASATRGASRST